MTLQREEKALPEVECQPQGLTKNKNERQKEKMTYIENCQQSRRRHERSLLFYGNLHNQRLNMYPHSVLLGLFLILALENFGNISLI